MSLPISLYSLSVPECVAKAALGRQSTQAQPVPFTIWFGPDYSRSIRQFRWVARTIFIRQAETPNGDQCPANRGSEGDPGANRFARIQDWFLNFKCEI